jgi:heat shock protein HslJ
MRLAVLLMVLAGPVAAQSLSGPDWRVVEIGGQAVPTGIPVTVAFDAGRVAGQSGCNRFSGAAVQDGQTLTLSAIAATRMACPPDRMEVETRMLSALSSVTGFALTPGGALELLGATGLLIRATRD